MDVEPRALGEQLGRDQQAVGAHDDRRGTELEPGCRPLGLQHGDPEALRDLFAGRRRHAAAPAGGCVGPRQQGRDVVSSREPLEDVRPERRGRGDGDPCHRRPTSRT